MSSAPTGVGSFSSRCNRSASQAPPVRMPTRPVESETPARSLRASSEQRASASGRIIEIVLQDDLRRERVRLVFVPARSSAGSAQRFARLGRGEPLVGEIDRQPEAGFELPCEVSRAPGDVVLAAVHREWKADDQALRPPFPKERLDLGHAPLAAFGFEHSQRAGKPGLGVADGDADPTGAEIKSEYGVTGDFRRGHGRLAHACPASSESLAKSTPRSFIAAGRRSSAGVSKMIASLASTVSHAFCLISFSSCPAAQPEYPSVTSIFRGPPPCPTASRMSLDVVRPILSCTASVACHLPGG